MKDKLSLLLALLATVTRSHTVFECFDQSILVGGVGSEGGLRLEGTTLHSDIDKLDQLSVKLKLTSIEVCTNRAASRVRGVQVTYGNFNNNGDVIDAVPMNAIGDVDESTSVCTNFYVPRDDQIARILLRYNSDGVSQLQLITARAKSASYGRQLEGDSLFTEQFSDDPVTGTEFYGFFGRSDQSSLLLSLGVLFYEIHCVRDEQARLGDEFSWANGSEVQVETQQETIIRKIDFELKDWQLYLTIVTLSMNIFVLFVLAIYVGYKCKSGSKQHFFINTQSLDASKRRTPESPQLTKITKIDQSQERLPFQKPQVSQKKQEQQNIPLVQKPQRVEVQQTQTQTQKPSPSPSPILVQPQPVVTKVQQRKPTTVQVKMQQPAAAPKTQQTPTPKPQNESLANEVEEAEHSDETFQQLNPQQSQTNYGSQQNTMYGGRTANIDDDFENQVEVVNVPNGSSNNNRWEMQDNSKQFSDGQTPMYHNNQAMVEYEVDLEEINRVNQSGNGFRVAKSDDQKSSVYGAMASQQYLEKIAATLAVYKRQVDEQSTPGN